jgi:hypothetical protein
MHTREIFDLVNLSSAREKHVKANALPCFESVRQVCVDGSWQQQGQRLTCLLVHLEAQKEKIFALMVLPRGKFQASESLKSTSRQHSLIVSRYSVILVRGSWKS